MVSPFEILGQEGKGRGIEYHPMMSGDRVLSSPSPPMVTKSIGSDCDCGLGVSLWRSRSLNQKLEFLTTGSPTDAVSSPRFREAFISLLCLWANSSYNVDLTLSCQPTSAL
jgi:hypothetical protein